MLHILCTSLADWALKMKQASEIHLHFLVANAYFRNLSSDTEHVY
jgi:hypothetical protein